VDSNDFLYKLLVLDIDGTLINKSGLISPADRDSIIAVKQKGISVVLCTGRATGASLNIIHELGLDGPHIFFDGTLVYDPQKDIEIYARPLPLDILDQITNYALREGLPLDLFSRNKFFVIEESWRTKIRSEFFNIQATVADLRSIWKTEKIVKGGLAVKTPGEIAAVKKMAVFFYGRINLTWTVTPAYPDIQFINITDSGSSKGKALKALCSHLSLPIEQVCAIGDGLNDISLLYNAGLGVAMQNAPDELKAVADYVTCDVENSGVSEALHRFLL
jgi:Cof subfamily protein (haloacid dehalogenase superfamily)